MSGVHCRCSSQMLFGGSSCWRQVLRDGEGPSRNSRTEVSGEEQEGAPGRGHSTHKGRGKRRSYQQARAPGGTDDQKGALKCICNPTSSSSLGCPSRVVGLVTGSLMACPEQTGDLPPLPVPPAVCQPPCQNRGSCSRPQLCVCRSGFRGARCEEVIPEEEFDPQNSRPAPRRSAEGSPNLRRSSAARESSTARMRPPAPQPPPAR